MGVFTVYQIIQAIRSFTPVSRSHIIPASAVSQHCHNFSISDSNFCYQSATVTMLRATKPKLTLSLPNTSAAKAAQRSPFPMPISPSPITSPTARNTALNQSGSSTYQPPTFAYTKSSGTKSILKKSPNHIEVSEKRIQFKETPTVTCFSPMPPGYYGEYIKMTADERRWGRRPLGITRSTTL